MIFVKASSLLFFAAELFILAFLLDFQKRKRKWWPLFLLIGMGLCVVSSIFSAWLKDYLMSFVDIDVYDFNVFLFTYSYSALSKLLLIFIVSVTLQLVFTQKLEKTVFLLCYTYSIRNMANSFFNITLLLLNPEGLPLSFILQVLSVPVNAVLYVVIYLVFYLFGFFFWKHEKKNLTSDFLYHKSVVLFILMIVINVILSSVNPPLNSKQADAVFFFVLVACLLLSVLEIFLQFFMAESNEKAIQKSQLERMVKEKNRQYEISKESIKNVNIAAHDLKGQLNMILKEIEHSSKKEDLKAGIDDVSESLDTFDSSYHTGFEPLDITLTEKASICKRNDILFTVMAEGTILSGMESLDVYMLLGNALDNAIEAVMKIPEKERKIINFRLRRSLGMVLCQIENTFQEPPVFRNGLPVTDKKDKEAHGYGIKSMKDIVEKYHGTLRLDVRDGLFLLEILLP